MEEVIGDGRTSKVYSAIRKNDKKRFAIKSIVKSDIEYEDLKLILNEIEILKLLDNPNIIKLHEVYESNIHIHLVLDFAEGDLSKYYSTNKISEQEISFIILKILETIIYYNSKSIIHRDLKPDNILFK